MAFSLVRRNAVRLMLYSLLFSTGWFSLSFSFPLLATLYNYGYVMTGFLGLIGSIPFLIVGALYLKPSQVLLRFGNIFPFVGLAVVTLFFILFPRSLFFLLVVLSSIIQSFWWISSEIALSLLGTNKSAEKYSAAWGIPNAALPIISGLIVEYYGFRALFIFSLISFIAGMFFIPKYSVEPIRTKLNAIKTKYVLPIFFIGALAGFVYFVLVPILKISGISYTVIGILIGVYGTASAVGYVVLNFTPKMSIRYYSIISSLMVFLLSLLFVTRAPFLVGIILFLTGIGTSIGVSKVLSYIQATSSTRIGVFYYESFFGVGFMVGSFGGGVLYDYLGISSVLIIFSIPIIYVVAILLLGAGDEATDVIT